MNKVLLIYWPEGGNVEAIADIFENELKDTTFKLTSIAKVTVDDLNAFDNWIVGGSTVGSHVWADADDSNKWYHFFNMLDKIDLSNKVAAFYGLGDQVLYPHHYVDGLGTFQEEFSKRNVKIVGQWPIDGYDFIDSEGVENDLFYGLALDEDRQEEMTENRITKWLELIRKDFN